MHGDKAILMFTNTHSLSYRIETKDMCGYFHRNKPMFDFSNYSNNSRFYDDIIKTSNW